MRSERAKILWLTDGNESPLPPDSPASIIRSSCAEAMQRLAGSESFAVLVAPCSINSSTLETLARRAGRNDPDLKVLLLAAPEQFERAIDVQQSLTPFRVLKLPVAAEVLCKALDDALHSFEVDVERRELVAKRTDSMRRMQTFVSRLHCLDALEDIAKLVVETTAQMMQSSRVSLMLPDHARAFLTIAAATGLSEEVTSSVRMPVGEAIAGRVFETGENVLINDIACACIVGASGKPLGVLNVTLPVAGTAYDAESLASLRVIGEAAGIAMENQHHRRQRDEARDSIILAMARLAEYRDPETGSHLQRLQSYCRLLAEQLAKSSGHASQLTREYIDDLVRSAPLHDLGKVGIPDGILKKPGKHSPEEMERMRSHTWIGGDALRSLLDQGHDLQFLRLGMELAYCHHEKWDGSGYPRGLKGESIPLSARILALGDVYDALTTSRVYKQAIPHENVREIIAGGRGKHFDPAVVKAFLDCEIEFARTALELADAPRIGESGATAADVEFPEKEEVPPVDR